MWLSILMSVLSSSMTKELIGAGINKLLDHTEDGVTKDVAEVMLDGIALSRSNGVDLSMVNVLKRAL